MVRGEIKLSNVSVKVMCSGNEKHFSEEVTRRNLSYDKRKNFSIRRAGTRLLNLSLNIYRTKEH